VSGEIVSKIIATIVNAVGIVAIIAGLLQTRQLLFKEPGDGGGGGSAEE
jgi:hypothetical protein